MSNNPTIMTEGVKKEKANISVVDHLEFKGDLKSSIISSIEMAEIVSAFFAPAFSDYYGCNIRVNDGHINPAIANSVPLGAIYVDLYFKDQGKNDKGGWKNLELNSNKNESGTDLSTRFFRVNNQANKSRAYKVTDETYEALEEFMFIGNHFKINWNLHTQEIQSPMSVYGKEEIVVCISGISLEKIISKIYGTVTDDARYEYKVLPETIIPNKNGEFIMMVFQLDNNAVRELQNTLGVYNPNAPMFHQYLR